MRNTTILVLLVTLLAASTWTKDVKSENLKKNRLVRNMSDDITKKEKLTDQVTKPATHNVDDIRYLKFFDAYGALVLCPIGFALSLTQIIMLFAFKDLHNQPNDLIGMIALSEMLLAFSWFNQAIYTKYIMGVDYDEDSTFCKVNAWIVNIAGTMDMTYQFMFQLFLLFKMNSIVKKSRFIKWWTFHALAFLNIAITLLVIGLNDRIGKNRFGGCSQKFKGALSGWFSMAIFSLLTLQSAYILYAGKNKIPSLTADMRKLKSTFMGYGEAYIEALLFFFLMGAQSSLIVGYIDVAKAYNGKNTFPAPTWFNIAEVFNNFKLIMPIVFFAIRCTDPEIASILSRRCCGQANRDYEELSEEEDDDLYHGEDLVAMGKDDYSFLDVVSDKLRAAYIRTMVVFLGRYFWNVLENPNFDIPEEDKFYVKMNGEKMKTEYNIKTDVIDCKVTIHAPNQAREIWQTGNFAYAFRAAMDYYSNEPEIAKSGINTGGASGEIFFFNFDKTVIFKTCTTNDIEQYNKMVRKYSKHLQRNPKSFIARIYGLLTFKFPGDEMISIIVMENLTKAPQGCYQLKGYDLKGSTIHRQTEMDTDYKEYTKDFKYKGTLKDLDYNEIQDTLKIGRVANTQLQNQLADDVEFLRKSGVLDYSMLFVQNSISDFRDWNALNGWLASPRIYRETDERYAQQYAYSIGILDFLTPWNCDKKMELCWKKTSRCNCSYDCSVQNPDFYSERYLDYFQERITE